MLEKRDRELIIALINREVVPAIGCTEPAAVALCAAYSREALQSEVAKVEVSLSANMLKNSMGVGIPGTGMVGLPAAVALGVLVGRADCGLEVLCDVTPQAIDCARLMIESGSIEIKLKDDCQETLYIEVTCRDAVGNSSMGVIAGSHTNLTLLKRNDVVLHDSRCVGNANDSAGETAHVALTMRRVWEFAMESPIDELRFILESRKINKDIAERSFIGQYGHCVGRTMRCSRQQSLMGDTVFSRVIAYTAAACDARMAGAPYAVMSNSGSGNQGIAATLPVVVYAEETFANEEQTIRALVLSHLTVIYIKQSLGRLSALCGCVVAATGSACGICYLMGGGYDQIAATTKNMVGNLAGMICDGAKPGCALKLASGVSMAMLSAVMAMESHCVSSIEGIVDEDVDQTVSNLTSIGHYAMRETDRAILEIMTSKRPPRQ